jgi:hypothetical protein
MSGLGVCRPRQSAAGAGLRRTRAEPHPPRCERLRMKYKPALVFWISGRRPDRCGGKMERTCTLGATAAVADMADMLRGRGGATRRGTRARDVLFCRRGGRSQGGFQSSF